MPSEFPFPSVNSSYPIPLEYQPIPEKHNVGRTTYDDNGFDKARQTGGVGVKGWSIKYAGLTLAQAAILDAWAESMFYSPDEGSAYGANFREHVPGTVWTDTSGTLWANVYIAPGGYKTGHTKAWSQTREFLLERGP